MLPLLDWRVGKSICAMAEPVLGGSHAHGLNSVAPAVRLMQLPSSTAPRGTWSLVSPGASAAAGLVAHRSLVFPAAEKVSSLGKDWHKFCLKCERCNKTLTPGGHAEVRAAGVDGVRSCAAMQGGLVGSPAPQGWRVPGIWQGQVPGAMWMGCPCRTQVQEHTLWLQVLLLRHVVLKSSCAQSWASHRVVLAPRVVAQLCHPGVGS